MAKFYGNILLSVGVWGTSKFQVSILIWIFILLYDICALHDWQGDQNSPRIMPYCEGCVEHYSRGIMYLCNWFDFLSLMLLPAKWFGPLSSRNGICNRLHVGVNMCFLKSCWVVQSDQIVANALYIMQTTTRVFLFRVSFPEISIQVSR